MRDGKRLQTVLSMVPRKAVVADIGCDHAILGIRLIEEKICERVLSCDINDGPLQNAKRNIELKGITGIELIKSDGLEKVHKGDADTIVMAGLGGDIICRIIESADWLCNESITLILQPMTHCDALRRYLYQNGFYIEKEKAVIDQKRVYSVMKIKFDKVPKPEEAFYYTGLLDGSDDASKQYLKKQLNASSKLVKSIESKEDLAELYKTHCSVIERIKKILGEK